MAEQKKGLIVGNMKFNVGEDAAVDEKDQLLPLRILVLADLVPHDDHNAGASGPDGVLKIDPKDFDDLFTRVRPRIAVEVPSVLREGRPDRVDLSPTSWKSFRPDVLINEVPLLRSLVDGRLLLERLKDNSFTREQARDELERLWKGSPFAREVLGLVPQTTVQAAQKTPDLTPPAASATASVDSILDMIDVGGASDSSGGSVEPGVPARPVVEAKPSKFAALIEAVAHAGRGPNPAPTRPNEAISRVERAIAVQLGAILQHPEVRRIEEAWRGLKFLADALQTYQGVRLDVAVCRPADAAKTMERAIKAGTNIEPPISFVVVDLDTDNTAASLARVEAIANVAEQYGVPAIASASHKLLGVESLAEAEMLDNKQKLFTAPQQVAWQSLAYKPALRWVSLVMNEVLLRPPYDKTSSRVREVVVREEPSDEGAFVWMSPVFAVAAICATSFKETGWPCRIVGPRNGTLANLPVHQLTGIAESEEGAAIPTRVFLSTDTQKELSKMGVLALASAPNSDAVQILSAPTAYVTPPKRTYDSATTEPEERYERVPLGDQLFVARVVQFLRALCGKLPASAAPGEVEPVANAALWSLFEGAPPASVDLSVKARAADGGTVIAVTLRPRRFLGVTLEEISFEMPLG